ncbi:glycoside hydrolase family 43 protein [Microbispora sp. NPDC049125]|uniref:glycoside hydrolase family 43 protein n=1 Tax=Microbispora sp. NPDC049125 TaxID=3154929 RepID=UPI0034676287
MQVYANPVLPGFYPDPSVCRVGDDYYLVTSSFEWFPGVPIFHSRDLVHWRQLGHVLDRPGQLDLTGLGASRGIFAPTLRHHDGVFYMVTTVVDGGGNFIVTARDPAGPWSDPVWVPEALGIDPSLLFDEGRVWLHGTRERREQAHDGDTEVWLLELDPRTLRPVGDERIIWDGSLKKAFWPEGPHIYRIGDRYYLLSAEGGTDWHHSIVIARSSSVTGPYEGYRGNPVLTHRHFGRAHPITGTGHADLIQTQHGEWWAVLLAMRPYGGYHYNLGRETFLTRVRWEDGWPLFDQVAAEAPAPGLPAHPWPAEPGRDDFDATELALCWNHLRTPHETYWSLTERPGHLRLRPRPETFAGNPSMLARRQRHQNFTARLAMEFRPEGDACAGLAVVQNDTHHYLLMLTADGLVLRDAHRVLAKADVPPGVVHLGVQARGQDYRMSYATGNGEWRPIGDTLDGRILSSTVAGGFTGAYVGMYAGGDGGAPADFDWFDYQGEGE